MQQPAIKEQDVLQEIWRKAGREAGGVTIPCDSLSEARRMRFTLYNALKPVKTGRVEADAELRYAMDNCSISFTDDQKGIVIRPKVSSKLNKILLGVLGGVVRSADDIAMEESVAKLMALAQETEAKRQELTGMPDEPQSKASSYGARSF